MKFLVFIFLFINFLYADEMDWEVERVNFYFENDIFLKSDSDYTDGSRLSLLLYRPKPEFDIPFTDDSEQVNFVSFSLTQQIFTPSDLIRSDLIEDDRPYAGWLYFETGLYQSSETDLDTLMVQFGIVGPASGMQGVQRAVHKIFNSSAPNGWDNQLNNEIGIQLNYQHKWRYVPEPLWGVESSIIPYTGVEVGNIAINANTGLQLRVGWNVPGDFGVSAINGGSENGVPVSRRCIYTALKPWSLNLLLASGASLVGRDIFLDGNTFSESHSVEKNVLKGYSSFGVSGRYKNFNVDYINTYYTKEFKTEDHAHSVGSLIFSYIYEL